MESKLGFWDLILSRLSQLPTLEWIIYQFLCFWGRDSTTQIFNCRRWWRGGAALWISPNPYIVQGSTVYAKCCKNIKSVQSVSSVAQSCPTFCDPMNHSTPGLPITNSQSSLRLTSIESMMPSNHLILCHPLLLLPLIPPSIRVFSNELALCIKYGSFSFNISPSSEHPGLISFRMDWLDLLVVQGTLKSLFQHHSSKAKYKE